MNLIQCNWPHISDVIFPPDGCERECWASASGPPERHGEHPPLLLPRPPLHLHQPRPLHCCPRLQVPLSSQVWWGGLKSTSTRMIQIWSIKTSVFYRLKSVNFNRKDHISPNSFGSKPTLLGSIWNILHLRETFSTYAEKDAYDQVRSDVIAFLHYCPTISHF